MLRLFHRNENSSNVVWESHEFIMFYVEEPEPLMCLTFECKPKLIAWTLFLQHQYQHQLPMTFGVCHTWYSCSTNTKLQNPATNSLRIAWIDTLNCLFKKYKVNSIHQTLSPATLNPKPTCNEVRYNLWRIWNTRSRNTNLQKPRVRYYEVCVKTLLDL